MNVVNAAFATQLSLWKQKITAMGHQQRIDLSIHQDKKAIISFLVLCVWGCACVNVCGRQRVDIKCLQFFSTLFFETGSSIQSLLNWAIFVGQETLGIFLSLPPQCWGYRQVSLRLDFMFLFGIELKFLCFTGKLFTNWSISQFLLFSSKKKSYLCVNHINANKP